VERAAGVSAKIKTYLGGYKNILGRQPREGDVLLMNLMRLKRLRGI
jgi:hypothetical protein